MIFLWIRLLQNKMSMKVFQNETVESMV
jgi:hypothetical protein